MFYLINLKLKPYLNLFIDIIILILLFEFVIPFNFEGEYVNGHTTGIVREYYDKDNIIFESKFLNGHKNLENDAVRYLIDEAEYANNRRVRG